jgi:hypothetical protein
MEMKDGIATACDNEMDVLDDPSLSIGSSSCKRHYSGPTQHYKLASVEN